MKNHIRNVKEQQGGLQGILKAQEQPIDCLTFSGGGAKGTIYGGVHAALHNSGVLVGVKAVSGASAGASTAAFIATGITAEDFQQACQIDVEKLLDIPENKGLFYKNNKPIQNVIAETIRKNVHNYLSTIDIDDNVAMNNLCAQRNIELENDPLLSVWEIIEQEEKLLSLITTDYQEIKELKYRCGPDGDGKIYFKDLALLRTLNPAKFKNLVINAVVKDKSEMKLFNAKDTPDAEIAEVCAASSAIALAFKSVEIDGVEYIDGGHMDNIPLNYFKNYVKNDRAEELVKENSMQKVKNRTLSMAFGGNQNSSAHVAVYSAKEQITSYSRFMKFLVDVVYKMVAKIGGDLKYTEQEEQTYQNLRKNALNTVILKPEGISTLSFKRANEQADYLYAKGYLQTTSHLNNHDIIKAKDPNIAQKQFLLEVYEATQPDSILSSWKDKIITGKKEKSTKLLSFVMSDKWNSQLPHQILEEFTYSAAINRSNGKLNSDTTTMRKMIKLLNNPKTSEIVRLNFTELLGVDIDNRLKQDKDFTKFKFKKEDFDQLLKKKKIVKMSSSRYR